VLFNSVSYLLFLPVVLGIYFSLPLKFRNPFLFVVSLYFYAAFRWEFLILLLFSIVVTQFFVIRMTSNPKKESLYLMAAIFSNLGILYIFKYLDFTVSIINALAIPLQIESIKPIGLMLPMGISFFTLQAISYAVDVKRNVVEPAKSTYHFGLFLAFFPQLVAGPILRASDVLKQFLKPHSFDKENLAPGFRFIIAGLFKKTLVADPIAIAIDPIYANPMEYNWVSLFLAGALFAIQCYCDFAGYSEIAIGTGKLLGFEIPINFNRPFLSGTMTELWRRWHISFSSWLRDYIYISLGGSKISISRTYLNLFITTFVSGLWHGADWTFIFWGAFHASLMVIEKFLFQWPKVKSFWEFLPKPVQMLYPCLAFFIAAVLFRSKPIEGYSGMEIAGQIYQGMFTGKQGLYINFPNPLFLALFALFVSEIGKEWYSEFWDRYTPKEVVFLAMAVSYTIAFVTYSVSTTQAFIYFQF